MLNYCILKKQRHQTVKRHLYPVNPHSRSSTDSFIQLSSPQVQVHATSNVEEELQQAMELPEGRKEVSQLNLLLTSDILWIPETQDVAPMTEDRIREQQETLEALGTGQEATAMRAHLQSAQLFSGLFIF